MPPTVRPEVPEVPAHIVDAVNAGIRQGSFAAKGACTGDQFYRRKLLDDQVKEHTDLVQKSRNLGEVQEAVNKRINTTEKHLPDVTDDIARLKANGQNVDAIETFVDSTKNLINETVKLNDVASGLKNAALNYPHPFIAVQRVRSAYTPDAFFKLGGALGEQGRQFVYGFSSETDKYYIAYRNPGNHF